MSESLSDVTLTCGGKFYSLHKFVLSTCSEYFEKIFQKTAGKHPVVVLKDISSEDFEALLHYMYIGEVNVVQERLAGLIKAAECLQIKGLAVPDDGQSAVSGKSSSPSRSKRSFQKSEKEISANRKKRKTSISSAEDISANSNHRDNEAQKSNNQAQNTIDHGQTSDDERSSTRSSKKRSSSKETPNFDSDSELQTNDSFVNNSEVHEVKIEPDETEQFFTEENVEDSKEDVLQGQLLQDNQLGTQENHQSSSLTSPQTEDMREWGSCGENAAFESAFSSFDQPSVLSGTSFLSAISQLRNLSSTVLTSDTPPPQPVTSTPQSQPATSSSNSANSSQQHSSKNTKAFCCNSCSYRTDVYHNLKIHLRTHTGERPYACPLCPYRGTQLFHVQRHMRTHTGEKPYGCHLCPYKSNRKDHLTEHMLASHKVDYRTRGVGIN